MKTVVRRMAATIVVAASCMHGAAALADTIVVQNHYYPKPGLEQEVLRTRLEASRVRKQFNLQVGRVLVRTNETTGQPYVIWECDYPSLEARAKDAAAAESAPAFAAVQEKMRTLIARFERSVWTVSSPP